MASFRNFVPLSRPPRRVVPAPRYPNLLTRHTNADLIVNALQSAGVQRLFGMPGGGSNAELLEAADRAGLPFTLAHTETASAFMAAAQAEITGHPGACIATLGPGAASLMNGLAHAFLDRVPLIVITDCPTDPATAGAAHQALPHSAMFAPIVKFTARLERGHVTETLRAALAAAVDGPVHLDLSNDVASAPAEDALPAPDAAPLPAVEIAAIFAKKPLLLIGLGACQSGIAELCERFHVPALVTYKAKGVVPDRHPWFAGVLTNGELEREILDRAGAFLAVGLDEVELLPKPWTYPQPLHRVSPHQLPAVLQLSAWSPAEVREFAESQRSRVRIEGPGLLPHRVVELTAQTYPGARVTVDAGAHMFPVMSLWPAEQPRDVLISNGLSTMGFALPAAIGAALLRPANPVVVFTGDGGILMCLAELRTAARENLPLRILVFDDGDLSLIRVKQEQRGYRTGATAIGNIHWTALAQSLGVAAFSAATESELATALERSAGLTGPVLIAARVNAGVYRETLQVLRSPAPLKR